MNVPSNLLDKYLKDPIGMDEALREALNLPDTKYYTVSVWPVSGKVYVDNRPRTVKAKKISKSDQKSEQSSLNGNTP